MSIASALFAVPGLIDAKNRIDQNIIQLESHKNIYNAFTSNDPVVREIANKRYECHGKFSTKQFKYMGFGLILPFLIIIIYTMSRDRISQQYRDMAESTAPVMALWIVVGICVMMYYKDEWNQIQTTINRATGSVLDNCEKLFSHL